MTLRDGCLSVSSYRIAPVERSRCCMPAMQTPCFQYPHIGSLRWNKAVFATLNVKDHDFQYPHIGSLRWNRAETVLCRAWQRLSVSSYRIAPVELPYRTRTRSRVPSFSILISDRSGGTCHTARGHDLAFRLSVSSYRIAPVERLPAVVSGRSLSLFQYPHIGSLRWNTSPPPDRGNRVSLSVSSYRIAPVERRRCRKLRAITRAFSILISDRSGGTLRRHIGL